MPMVIPPLSHTNKKPAIKTGEQRASSLSSRVITVGQPGKALQFPLAARLRLALEKQGFAVATIGASLRLRPTVLLEFEERELFGAAGLVALLFVEAMGSPASAMICRPVRRTAWPAQYSSDRITVSTRRVLPVSAGSSDPVRMSFE